MTFPVDRVIVSSNEHWLYLDFWPFVAYAYRALFPGVRVTLAFVSERLESDPFVAQLREHGEVVLIRPIPDMPQSAQTKMARYWLAAQAGDDVVYIDDIDVIPIDAPWHAEKVAQRQPGTMLFIGAEVYGKSGQVPASMMTGEGYLFRALFNPGDLSFPDYLDSLRGRTGEHRDIDSRVQHEGMDCNTTQERLGTTLFSDEKLIMSLRSERPIPVTMVARSYETGRDTIDRSYMQHFDRARLEAGGYLTAHAGRPYGAYQAENDAIMDYIRRRYGAPPMPAPPVKPPGIDPDMEFGGSGLTREAFNWIAANIPAGSFVVETGSGHVSTNYLSRRYWLASIEHDLRFVNIYPSHYIYAPLRDGWYDPDWIRDGLVHSRFRGREVALLIVDGPIGSEPRAGILRHPDLFTFRSPMLIDDTGRETERAVALEIARRTGRPVQWFDSFAVV